ncbi:MAG TPA: hypothetical protein VEY50_10960 [Lysobacter sp.]|nr:hypothetical protein [Lysobacter sp.]
MTDTHDATWNAYYDRKRNERLQEADAVWRRLAAAGVSEDTVLVIDFTHFGADRTHAEALAQQLSEHYATSLEPGPDGYWLVKGTTRPYGVSLTEDQHRDWVDFMCDAARPHGCVFSTWTVDVHPHGPRVSSEGVTETG